MSLSSFVTTLKALAAALAVLAGALSGSLLGPILSAAAGLWWIFGPRFRGWAAVGVLLPGLIAYSEAGFYPLLGAVLAILAAADLGWYLGAGATRAEDLRRRIRVLGLSLSGAAVVASIVFEVDIGLGFWPTAAGALVMVWAALRLVRTTQGADDADNSSSSTSAGS